MENPVDFDPVELLIGTAHEMEEHQLDLKMGVKIASDHLKDHPDYYTKLKEIGL